MWNGRKTTKIQMQECMDYFQKRPVFLKLFERMREKYASLGYFGGKVTLDYLTQEEKKQLGGFFRKDYQGKEKVVISAEQFRDSLEKSKFAGISPEDILEACLDKPLVVKKEEKRREELQREIFFQELIRTYRGTAGGNWLEKVLTERKNGYYIFRRQYRENPEKLRSITEWVMNGISSLSLFSGSLPEKEKEMLPLAVLAAKVSGNPHCFDSGTTAEKMLLAFLEDYFSENNPVENNFVEKKQELLSETEQKNRLFFQSGILKDDLSNAILAYGIRGWKTDGRIHRGLEGYFQEKEPIHITLRTLGKLLRAEAQQDDIYVVENPADFHDITGNFPSCAAICVNGQPGLAALVLLDMLKENHRFHYAGDFDPEGLLIAQHLKERYGNRLKLWNYRVEWYEKYCSDTILEEYRLKKLEKVYLKELQEIKRCMYKEKKAAYQEAMLSTYKIPQHI